MSYRICETLETEKQAMRDVYCQTMIDLANQNDRIVVMDADLMNSVGTVPFGEAHPERTVNCGIQEANMIGVAAGMSASPRGAGCLFAPHPAAPPPAVA